MPGFDGGVSQVREGRHRWRGGRRRERDVEGRREFDPVAGVGGRRIGDYKLRDLPDLAREGQGRQSGLFGRDVGGLLCGRGRVVGADGLERDDRHDDGDSLILNMQVHVPLGAAGRCVLVARQRVHVRVHVGVQVVEQRDV